MRIDQRPQVVKTIGSDDAGGNQFPQAFFHLGGQRSGCTHKIDEKTSATFGKRTPKVLRNDTEAAG
jgi:hypothetical protein